MEIDIISYTDKQFASMTTEQILEVRKAQEKKNKLEKKLAQSLQEAEKWHIEKGTYHSTPYQKSVENLQAECEKWKTCVRHCFFSCGMRRYRMQTWGTWWTIRLPILSVK